MTNNTDNIEILISDTIQLVNEEDGNMNKNSQIPEMCSFFINLGKKNIIAEEFADISYQSYLKKQGNNEKLNKKIKKN